MDIVYQHVAKARERMAIRERWRALIRYSLGPQPPVPLWFFEKEGPAILAEPECVKTVFPAALPAQWRSWRDLTLQRELLVTQPEMIHQLLLEKF